jgi:hypothetical protein
VQISADSFQAVGELVCRILSVGVCISRLVGYRYVLETFSKFELDLVDLRLYVQNPHPI